MNKRSDFQRCPFDGAKLVPSASQKNPRPSCTVCDFVDYGNPRPCVAIFLTDGERVLMGRRAENPAKGKWDILGGFIDHGETAEVAVLREAFEETNLQVEIVMYLGSLPDVYSERQYPTLNLVYVVRRVSGVMRAKTDVAELQWFALDQLPNDLAFPHQSEAVKMLRCWIGSTAMGKELEYFEPVRMGKE